MLATRDTKQTILAVAAELFRRQGYAATSMGQVAELSGISKGNLTYHFRSKQALWEGVLEVANAYVRERLIERSFDEAEEAIAGLEEFARRIRRWCLDPDEHFVGCLFTNIAVETLHSDEAVGKSARNVLLGFSDLLAERFAMAQQAGEIRDDLPSQQLARMFFWMYEGALTMARAVNDAAEYDAFRASLRPWLAP